VAKGLEQTTRGKPTMLILVKMVILLNFVQLTAHAIAKNQTKRSKTVQKAKIRFKSLIETKNPVRNAYRDKNSDPNSDFFGQKQKFRSETHIGKKSGQKTADPNKCSMSCGRLSNKCSAGDFRTSVLNKRSSQVRRTSVRFLDSGGVQLWGWRVYFGGSFWGQKFRDQGLIFAD